MGELLLYFAAVRGSTGRHRRYRIWPLTCGGADGIRTRDPLTARELDGIASGLYQQQQFTKWTRKQHEPHHVTSFRTTNEPTSFGCPGWVMIALVARRRRPGGQILDEAGVIEGPLTGLVGSRAPTAPDESMAGALPVITFGCGCGSAEPSAGRPGTGRPPGRRSRRLRAACRAWRPPPLRNQVDLATSPGRPPAR